MISRGPLAGLALLALGLGGTSPLGAQSGVQRIRLEGPDARSPEPFSAIAGLRELSDGRLLLSDQIEQTLVRLDLATGAREELGRRGGGPGEYRMPGELLALPGDTTLMRDMGNQRFQTILPNGSLSDESLPARHPHGWPLFPRGVDSGGNIYFDLAGMMIPGLEESAAKGIAPILRWDRRGSRVDTMGYVNFPPMEPTGPGEARIQIGGGPYQGQDDWGVTPDGRIAVARYRDYHVEWLGGAEGPVVGPSIDYEPVKIGRAEKEAWADRMASRGIMIEEENGRRRMSRPPRPDVDRMEFPEVMPPFTGRGAVQVTPEGEVWVERSRPASERERMYDVFDGRGRLVKQVLLPEGRRLIGFGKGVLYAVRVDQDDLEWLERYRR